MHCYLIKFDIGIQPGLNRPTRAARNVCSIIIAQTLRAIARTRWLQYSCPEEKRRARPELRKEKAKGNE